MNEGCIQILQKNISRVQMQACSAAEKNFAHLRELARIIGSSILKATGETELLRALFSSDEAVHIYRKALSASKYEMYFSPINREDEMFFRRQSERFLRFYLCKNIAEKEKNYSLAELFSLFYDTPPEASSRTERKIAFLRNHQTFRAFECFAKTLGGVSVLYENNFQNACEAVEMGQAAYAIIPIYSTSDGRLSSFYRMIEKYELNIALICDIDSEDGESMTTFALLQKERICLNVGAPKFECQITFDTLSDISDITEAAYYYGASVESIEAIPVMFSGRAGTFSVVFDLTETDIKGLICYLALEYPQMSSVGIYGKTERT